MSLELRFHRDPLTNRGATVIVAVYDKSNEMVDTRWAAVIRPVKYFATAGRDHAYHTQHHP